VDFAFLFNNIIELTITGLALGAIYGLVALGYTMVCGCVQLINFAHSEVFMCGTFAVSWVMVFVHGTSQVDQSLWGTIGLLGLCLAAAMETSALIALLRERGA